MNHQPAFSHVILTLCLLVFGSALFAQNSGRISGIVVDKSSQQRLPFVNVTVAGTGKGSITDSVGAFRITDIPPGSYSVEISLIGYKKLTLLM